MAKSALKRKQEEEIQKNNKFNDTLKHSSSPAKKKSCKKDNRVRLKEIYDNLIAWISLYINHYMFRNYVVRSVASFKVLSFDERTMRKSIVNHVFRVYKIPEFLMNAFCYNNYNDTSNTYTIMKWIIDITSGKSFYKENKNYFTKKEAHFFVNSPDDYSISKAIVRAKCKARNLNIDLMKIIMNKYDGEHFGVLCAKQFDSFLDFIVRNQNRKITKGLLEEVIDYVDHFTEFSFKKRTWNSVVRLSKNWHRNSIWSKYATPYREWKPINSLNFEFIDDCNTSYKFIELVNSDQLLDESVAMNHCVVTYSYYCSIGERRIFTLTSQEFESKRFNKLLTIEVVKNNIVQIRGNYNRRPTSEELAIVAKWERKFNIQIKK